MTGAQFRGGPINGMSFRGLGRTPTFVRVVLDRAARKYDVLNDLDDAPTEAEGVVGVYVMDETSRVYACIRGSGSGGSGWWVTYVYLPIVGVERLRDEQSWCERLAAICGVPVEVVAEQRAAERAG